MNKLQCILETLKKMFCPKSHGYQVHTPTQPHTHTHNFLPNSSLNLLQDFLMVPVLYSQN